MVRSFGVAGGRRRGGRLVAIWRKGKKAGPARSGVATGRWPSAKKRKSGQEGKPT